MPSCIRSTPPRLTTKHYLTGPDHCTLLVASVQQVKTLQICLPLFHLQRSHHLNTVESALGLPVAVWAFAGSVVFGETGCAYVGSHVAAGAAEFASADVVPGTDWLFPFFGKEAVVLDDGFEFGTIYLTVRNAFQERNSRVLL
jgi:hypothetical protein